MEVIKVQMTYARPQDKPQFVSASHASPLGQRCSSELASEPAIGVSTTWLPQGIYKCPCQQVAESIVERVKMLLSLA